MGNQTPGMFSFITQRGYCHLFIALAVGIALGRAWPMPYGLLQSDWLLISLILAGIIFIWWLWWKVQDWRNTCLGLALTIILGFLSSSIAVGQALSAPLRGFTSFDPVTVIGRVTTIPKHQRGHLRFVLEVETVNGDPAPGSCFVYLKCEKPLKLYMTDHIKLYASLSEVEPPLNQGEFDYRGYLLRQGTVMTAYATSPDTITRLSSVVPQPWATTAQLRKLLISNLQSAIPGDLGLLAVSVVFGDKITELPEDLESRFRRAGLTHILVASGTQVSLLIALVSLMFWRLTDDFSWQGLLKASFQFFATMAVVLVYASITGFDTSIVRALLMGALIMFGRLFRREADGLSILAQSGVILLVANPLALYSPGFQLSFGATFGLIYILGAAYPFVMELSGWRLWVTGILVSTGGAQLFVAPLVAASFHQLSLWGMVSNVVAIPLSFALLISGTLLSLGAGMIPLLGGIFGWICMAISWLLNTWAGLFSRLPGALVNVPHQPLWWTLAFYAFIILAVELVKHGATLDKLPRRIYMFSCLAMALLLTATYLDWVLVPKPGLTALSLNKSEAFVWRAHTGRTVVLAKSGGLAKSHNSDKLVDALVYRGINKIHSWQWIDDDCSGCELFEPWMRFENSSAENMKESDIVLFNTGGKTVGAVFGLGADRVFLYWDWPNDGLRLHNGWVSDYGEPNSVILSATASEAINPTELNSVLKSTKLGIVHRKPKFGSYTDPTARYHWGELNMLPGKVLLYGEKGNVTRRLE